MIINRAHFLYVCETFNVKSFHPSNEYFYDALTKITRWEKRCDYGYLWDLNGLIKDYPIIVFTCLPSLELTNEIIECIDETMVLFL